MTSIVMLHILVILAFLVPRGEFGEVARIRSKLSRLALSEADQKTRLYHLLRQTQHAHAAAAAVLSLPVATAADASESSGEFTSVEDDHQIRTRKDWDSGERSYFQWVNKNRRPVEYFGGRKRDADAMIMSTRGRRINGGLWKSGLIG